MGKIDVSLYADPNYNRHQMEDIRNALKAGFDPSSLLDFSYYSEQMKAEEVEVEEVEEVEVKAKPVENYIRKTASVDSDDKKIYDYQGKNTITLKWSKLI